MKWIESSGGPLICIENELAIEWMGIDGSKTASNQPTNDYARACELKDYLGRIELINGSALILGDEPLPTTVLKKPDSDFIIRVYYMDSDADVPALLNTIDDSVFNNPIESLVYNVKSSKLIIFDSAISGGDYKKPILVFNLLPGKYNILTKRVDPDSRTSFLLHKFYRIHS